MEGAPHPVPLKLLRVACRCVDGDEAVAFGDQPEAAGPTWHVANASGQAQEGNPVQGRLRGRAREGLRKAGVQSRHCEANARRERRPNDPGQSTLTDARLENQA